MGKRRSSQQGNEDRIQLGFLSRNTFDGLWQFEKENSQLEVLFSASGTEKLLVDFRDTFFSFVQCSVSLRICLTAPEYLTFFYDIGL